MSMIRAHLIYIQTSNQSDVIIISIAWSIDSTVQIHGGSFPTMNL